MVRHADGASALVIGYGRFGQTVAQMLMASDIHVTLIDRDTEIIDVAGEFGSKVYFGDGTRIDLLRHRALTASRSYGFEPVVHTPELLELVRDDWRALRPLVEWLARA